MAMPLSHAEAGAADEGEDESGEPGQHHVWAAAEENISVKIVIVQNDKCFYLSILSMLNIL